MNNGRRKQLSNPFSTGGGGSLFEAHIQASFVALMLTGGVVPALPTWPIARIKLQAKVEGYETDDAVIFVENSDTKEQVKLLVQAKHSVAITKGDKVFGEVIQAAWIDFNGSKFNRGRDIIALVTGPLSQRDLHNAKWILDQATSTADHKEFMRNLSTGDFSPPYCVEKYEAFKYHIIKANDDVTVGDDVIYEFLKDFRLLGYDLDGQVGVVLSLLHSHIGQLAEHAPDLVWSRLLEYVQKQNKLAGTIIWGNIPHEIQSLFRKKLSFMPSALSQDGSSKIGLISQEYKNDDILYLFCLLGGWNEASTDDKQLVQAIAKADYGDLIKKVRALAKEEGSPVSWKDGHWSVVDRKLLWQKYAKLIYDEHLDAFKTEAQTVLSELDPSLIAATENRVTFPSDDSTRRYSEGIRAGVAETLALLGNQPESLTGCTKGNASHVAKTVIRAVLHDANLVVWGSLNSLLPIIAEANPELFLLCVERALKADSTTFSELFAQENAGFFGRNYMTGVLYALETLAWQESSFVRVCLILARLASIDPGGQWANRPSNSLLNILLPWMPQTKASIEKRRVAVQTMFKEFPAVASRLAFNLLPNQVRSSSGTRKPVWMDEIPDDSSKEIDQKSYLEQVSNYANLLIDWAGHSPQALNALIENSGSLPKHAFDQLVEALSSPALQSISEVEKQQLWTTLTHFVRKNRRFPEAFWSLSGEALDAIDKASKNFEPSDPFFKHRVLFSASDFDLYEENDDYGAQVQRLEEKRVEAIREILATGNTQDIIEFAKAIEHPYYVGYSSGTVGTAEMDAVILPSLLNSQDLKMEAVSKGYAFRRHQLNGWPWAEDVIDDRWSKEQVGKLLTCLPFHEQTWSHAAEWLGKQAGLYWKAARIDAFEVKENFDFVVKKLLENERPIGAIDFIYIALHRKGKVRLELVHQALMDAVKTHDPMDVTSVYHLTEIIGRLQKEADFDEQKLFEIEWAYLPVLERHSDIHPRTVEKAMATNPELFAQVISLVYRAEGEAPSSEDSDPRKVALATNAWHLLRNWAIVPGMQSDGSFDAGHFKLWLEKVRTICAELGRVKPALYAVGAVCIHTPRDDSGLWINKDVAEVLNAPDADEMRGAYESAVINSRGVHTVDPEAKPEKALAAKYAEQADEVENAGFARFAVTLRELANFYLARAEEILSR